jgi:hypothetical protein
MNESDDTFLVKWSIGLEKILSKGVTKRVCEEKKAKMHCPL